MKIIQLIKKRRSVRCFKEKDRIPKKDINLILESARWAPSARNLQPLEFIIVKDRKIRKKLSRACRQNQPQKAPLVIAVVGNLNLEKKLGKISSHDTTTNYKGTHVFVYMDAAAAIQNMLLTAASLGIDSLWIGSFNASSAHRILKLPKNYLTLAVLCFGHRAIPPFSPQKRTIKERLHIDRFRRKTQDLSYLEECKLINEPKGELKNYRQTKSF